MTDRIDPALTAEEWAEHRAQMDDDSFGYAAIPYWAGLRGEAAAIAIANDLLPDSDRRKITRERIQSLRAVAEELEYDDCTIDDEASPGMRARRMRLIGEARALADALESYLPGTAGSP